MLAYRLAMLLAFLLVFHQCVVLVVTANFAVHRLDGLLRAGQGVTEFGHRWHEVFDFDLVTVVLLQGFALLTEVRVFFTFVVHTDAGNYASRVLTAADLDAVQEGGLEHLSGFKLNI